MPPQLVTATAVAGLLYPAAAPVGGRPLPLTGRGAAACALPLDAALLRLLPLPLLLMATGWKGQGLAGISFCAASALASASR